MTHENRINATDEPNDSRSLIDRRTYLKGTVTAAAVAAGAFSTATSAQEYDTITVPANTRHNITVGSGETLENLLIDMTASGASAHITTQGSDWTIRNVGFKGNHPGGHYLMTPGVSSSSGTALIENVYLGDGQTEHSGSGGIWINANLPHRGTITFRNIHVAHMIDNGLYGSGPGAQGYNGNAHVEDSYFLSNNISNIRLSSRGPESSVTNCTVEVDGTTRECGEGCSSWGAVNNRGVWAWYGNVDVIDSNIQGSLPTTSGGNITLINTQTGSSADTTPPDGVPMTAEEAASGGDSIVGDSNHFSVEGGGEFYLEVSGQVEPDPSIAPYTTYGETHGDDWIGFELSSSGSTEWWFTGSVVELDSASGQTVEINGEEVDDGDFDWSEFFIQGEGSFYLEVSGTVEPHEDLEPWVTYGQEYGDDWVDNTLSSNPSTNYNTWLFTGDIVQLDTASGQTVEVDGEPYGSGATVVDDFERSNPLADYGGVTSLFSVETGTVYEGSQALVNDGGSFGSAVSTSGLSNYPSRGDEVTVYFNNAGDDNFVAFHLFAQSAIDNPDSYSVGISGAGAWRMWRHDGGNVTQIASDSLSASEQISGWYRAEISSDSSTVYADLYDDASDTLLSSIQANDTTYSSGGIGFRSAGNGEVWDYVVR